MHRLLVKWEQLSKFIHLKDGESLEDKCFSAFDLKRDIHNLTFKIYVEEFETYADFDLRDLPASAMIQMQVSVEVVDESEETQFTGPDLFEEILGEAGTSTDAPPPEQPSMEATAERSTGKSKAPDIATSADAPPPKKPAMEANMSSSGTCSEQSARKSQPPDVATSADAPPPKKPAMEANMSSSGTCSEQSARKSQPPDVATSADAPPPKKPAMEANMSSSGTCSEQSARKSQPPDVAGIVEAAVTKVRRTTRERLGEGLDLSRSDWTAFMEAVYAEHRNATGHNYPDSYEDIASLILGCYPWIMGKVESGEARMQLTRKLNIKFKNMRKRSVSPSVVEFREERSKKRQQYRQVTVAKLPNYNPPVVNSATTDEGLINLLKFDKNADTHQLMISTFPRRRQELLGTKGRRGMTMAALKRRFPALFTFEQCIEEYLRLRSSTESRSECLRACREKMAPFLAAACNKMHACNDDSAAETLLRVLGEYEHVLPEDAPRRPHVKKEDDEEEEPRYTVWVEGFSVGEAGSLVDALTLWACAFFIFHQKTGRLQKNTCWFMRCYILDLPVEKAVDRNVAKAIQDMVR